MFHASVIFCVCERCITQILSVAGLIYYNGTIVGCCLIVLLTCNECTPIDYNGYVLVLACSVDVSKFNLILLHHVSQCLLWELKLTEYLSFFFFFFFCRVPCLLAQNSVLFCHIIPFIMECVCHGELLTCSEENIVDYNEKFFLVLSCYVGYNESILWLQKLHTCKA